VLCVDTCTVLDVMRDITREEVRPADARCGLELLQAAETGSKLIVLMLHQVQFELGSNLTEVEEDAKGKLAKFQRNAQRIHEVATVFGATGTMTTSHLNGHVARGLAVVQRWKAVSRFVPDNAGVTGRAFARVNACRTPATLGKQSMKDCVVAEGYIEAAGQLRAAGMVLPIVFASANTKDYRMPNTARLKQDIQEDFDDVGLSYASNFGAAKSLLAL